jgi:hypothetical protein
MTYIKLFEVRRKSEEAIEADKQDLEELEELEDQLKIRKDKK